MQSDIIIYEQPLNEHIRVCLRLEHLFCQADHSLHATATWDSCAALAAILEILNVIDRPDLKTKLAKALRHNAILLGQLQQSPQVDANKLRQVLQDLEDLMADFHAIRGKFGENLRTNEFLTAVRLHLSKQPGGICSFSVPAYHLWLQQPAEQRILHLTTWLHEFDQLRAAVTLLLQLVRSSAASQQKIAMAGFYQEALTTNIPYQLIRVSMPHGALLFPEISAGRHGLSIHFFIPNFNGRAMRASQNVEFKLACCAVGQQ